MSGFHEIVHAGEREARLFLQGREEAAVRLAAAKGMCDAVADQPMIVQAEATIDYENDEAVASEWGLVSIATKLDREARCIRQGDIEPRGMLT